jgi:hypothetical protein
MVLQLPPAMPPIHGIGIALVTIAPQTDMTKADCQKGSRDCFPEDRVGAVPVRFIQRVVFPEGPSWIA